MKVLITGATGQVGGALLKYASSDHEIVGLGSSDCDLTDERAIHRLIEKEKPDWVINSAAYTAVDKAESEPDLAMAINAKAPQILAEALAGTCGRLFQVSTDFVFDGTASTPYATNAQRNPLSVYGKTKALGEDAAGEDAIILRTSWVYSAGGSNFVRTMLRLMKERDELRVVADQFGSPSWTDSIAKTIWSLVAHDARGTFHHRDAGETSWYRFALAIAEEARHLGLIANIPNIHPIKTHEYPTPALRPSYSVLDDRGTRALLGDTTQVWRDNLRAMLIQEKALG